MVTQRPHVTQARSDLLNPSELFRLVRNRLNPAGVFRLYSNESGQQRRVLRKSAAREPKEGRTLFRVDRLNLSDTPLLTDLNSRAYRVDHFKSNALWRETQTYNPSRRTTGVIKRIDQPRLQRESHGLLVKTGQHLPGSLMHCKRHRVTKVTW